MNTLMILGIGIIVLGVIVSLSLYYKLSCKSKNRQFYSCLLAVFVLSVFTVSGGSIAQAGHNQGRLQFNENEVSLLDSDKSYLDFTSEERELFSGLQTKYLLNEEEKMLMYHDVILNWAIDRYLYENKHRADLTRNDAEVFILREWEEKREFYNEN